jgi:hypothetical protein
LANQDIPERAKEASAYWQAAGAANVPPFLFMHGVLTQAAAAIIFSVQTTCSHRCIVFTIGAGTEDLGVPLAQSAKLHEKLLARGSHMSELVIIDGAGHGGPVIPQQFPLFSF